MPELPDVEIFRQYAEKHALNKTITGIDYNDAQVLESSRQLISKSLLHESFTNAQRRGKYVLLKCGSRWLVLHFGMTGNLQYFDSNDDTPEYAQMVIRFDNGHSLAYISKRKLGRIMVAREIDDFFDEHDIGEDALEVDWEDFKKIMKGKHGGIKSALMDQSKISGVGNIYADEILFQEKIHPETRLDQLDDDSLKSLYNTMRRVMRVAIRHDADPQDLPRDYLLANRSEGRSCPVCSGTIKKMTVNGRSTYICPKCQKKIKS